MSTQQAEDVLKHAFKQLEKMLNDVSRQEAGSRRNRPVREGNTGRKNVTGGSGKRRK